MKKYNGQATLLSVPIMVGSARDPFNYGQSVDKSKWRKTSVYRQVKLIKGDRPGTSVSGDPNDLEALSPNQLLQIKGKPIMLKSSTIKEDEIK